MEEDTQAVKLSCGKTLDVEWLLKQSHSHMLTLEEACGLLCSPDSGEVLEVDAVSGVMTDGLLFYPIRKSVPLLLPQKLQPYFSDRLKVPSELANGDAFMQYFLLASIKQSGEINAAPDNEHYRRHLYRMHDFMKDAKGLVLDVGCDNPKIGASLLPPESQYLGLDPFCTSDSEFRLIGVGEFLPIKSCSCKGVMFNTSLDHILDWRRAIDEAHRVLVDGGTLYICSLVWTDRADLLQDSVHFHHFREYELFGALSDFEVGRVRRYDYKGDDHRYGIYLSARKVGSSRLGS